MAPKETEGNTETNSEPNEYSNISEISLILLGSIIYYFYNSPTNFWAFLGGLTGMSLGAILIGYIPYILLRSKHKNIKLKIFAVSFLLANLLVWASGIHT